MQGTAARRDGITRNDMMFRPALNAFRLQWEQYSGGLTRPADGFWIINELRIPRRRSSYPVALLSAYQAAIAAIAKTVRMPIQICRTRTLDGIRETSAL